MKLLAVLLSLWVLAFECNASAAAETIHIQISVRKKMAGNVADVPFQHVVGFYFRQNTGEFRDATCPNASDADGTLICQLTCQPTGTNLRLYLQAPEKERSRIVVGLTRPAEILVEIAACRVRTRLPLVVMYKSPELVLDELRASAPDLFNLITFEQTTSKVEFKPFQAIAKDLEGLTYKPINRAALLDLSRAAVADSERETGMFVVRYDPGKPQVRMQEYVVGSKNAILFGATAEAVSVEAALQHVKVTSSASDFATSTTSVRDMLNKKAALSEQQSVLYESIWNIKREGPRSAGVSDGWQRAVTLQP